MKSLLLGVIAIFVLAAPVRLVAYWFGAKRQTWNACIFLLFLGALFVSGAVTFLPQPWFTALWQRFALIFIIFFVVSALVLEIKLWQAAVLSIAISLIYSFAVSPPGMVGVGVHIGA